MADGASDHAGLLYIYITGIVLGYEGYFTCILLRYYIRILMGCDYDWDFFGIFLSDALKLLVGSTDGFCWENRNTRNHGFFTMKIMGFSVNVPLDQSNGILVGGLEHFCFPIYWE